MKTICAHVVLTVVPCYSIEMKQFVAILLLLFFRSFIGIKCSEEHTFNSPNQNQPETVKPNNTVVTGTEATDTAPTVSTVSTDLKSDINTEMKMHAGSLVYKTMPQAKAQEFYVSDTSTSTSSDMTVTAGQLESSPIELKPTSSFLDFKIVLLVVFFLIFIIFVTVFVLVNLKQRDNRIHHQDFI